jgi:cyanate permease
MCCVVADHGRGRQEEGMIIAIYLAAAVIMAVGSLYFAWRSRDFRKFLAACSLCHLALCSISISPMFRCLCWGPILS